VAKPVFAPGDNPLVGQINSWFVNVNFARKTGTQSVSNSTLVSDNDLSVAVEANAIYTVRLVLLYVALTAADIKVLFRTPASGSFTGMGKCLVGSASAQTELQALPYTGNSSEQWGGLGAGNTAFGQVDGMLVTAGTPGNLTIEWAQFVTNGTATQVQGNSFLELRRVS